MTPEADSRAEYLGVLLARLGERPEPTPLTRDECRTLFLASHGLGSEEAAPMLHSEVDTVDAWRDAAQVKLAAKNPVHAVAIALRTGLFD